MAKIAKNTTGSDIVVSDVGVTIPALSSYTIHPADYYLWAASANAASAINSGNLVINDGLDDLKIVNSLRHLQDESIPRHSAFLATGSVLATSASTLTLTASSQIVIIFTGTDVGQIVKLPNATTLNLVHRYEVWNTSTQSVTIQDYGGNSIFTMAASQKTWITLQDNTTTNGTWLFEANFLGGSGGGNGMMCFGFDGNGSVGRWLESLTNIASNLAGYVVAGSKAVRSISIAGSSASPTYTCTVTFYKNGVSFETITLSSARKNTKVNLNHILSNLDEISAQITSGSIVRPVVVLWL